MPLSTKLLRHRRVLLVEDEAAVSLLLEDYLLELGADSVEVASRLDRAVAAAERADVQFAIVDVNLAGEMSYPAARALFERGIPFLFATGYGRSGLDPEWRAFQTLQKPFSECQ